MLVAETTIIATHLPGGGLPSEEVMVERAVRGIKLGLQEDATIGYGLQRGGTFVGKAKPDEQLRQENQKKKKGEGGIMKLISRFNKTTFKSRKPHLGLSEQLLQLLLRQQAVVLYKGGHLWRTLRLVVDRAVDLHVAMQNGQELFFPLCNKQKKKGT